MDGVARIWGAFAFAFVATSILALSGFEARYGSDALTAALCAVGLATMAIIGPEVHRLDPARLKRRHHGS